MEGHSSREQYYAKMHERLLNPREAAPTNAPARETGKQVLPEGEDRERGEPEPEAVERRIALRALAVDTTTPHQRGPDQREIGRRGGDGPGARCGQRHPDVLDGVRSTILRAGHRSECLSTIGDAYKPQLPVDDRRRHGSYSQPRDNLAPLSLRDVKDLELDGLLARNVLPKLLGATAWRAPFGNQELYPDRHCVQRMH